MRLVLVRHGETEANAAGRWQGGDDTLLSTEGRLQAKRLSDRFSAQAFQPTRVATSPLRRAAETAEILVGSRAVTVEVWDDLKEHGVGVFTGLTWDEISARYPKVAAEFQKARRWDLVEGAEPVAHRRVRADSVARRITQELGNDEELLVVSHGGILQHILAALLGSRHTWGISIANTAVFDFSIDLVRLHLEGDSPANPDICRINAFNDATHLL